jgi:hypothetical protein
MNRQLNNLRMCFSPHMNYRQWVVDVLLMQTPSRCTAVSSFQFRVSVEVTGNLKLDTRNLSQCSSATAPDRYTMVSKTKT